MRERNDQRLMKKLTIDFQLLLTCVICLVLTSCGCTPAPQTAARNESPQRLISTAPSITETLFDIGIGDRIIGDSQFTSYPPEASEIEKIGGLYDANWEKIVELAPDLVLMLEKNENYRLQCRKLGIESLMVDHVTMEGVLASYDLIGERLGPEVMQMAQAGKTALKEKLDTLQSQSESLQPVRVLICIDRTRESGKLQNVFVAGTNPYYQDVIRWAGGVNVAESTGLAFPNISVEAIVAMNPDVIVDLMMGVEISPSTGDTGTQEDDLTSDWKTLGDAVNAVKTGRVYTLTESYATIPGPRAPLFIKKLAEILHSHQ